MTARTFQELIQSARIQLPDGFAPPAWDPVPVLARWNREYGPEVGVPHWDGNAVLRDEIVDLTLLPAEQGMGADSVVVRIWNSGVVSLSFNVGREAHPLGGITNGDELWGMLRVLRVVRASSAR